MNKPTAAATESRDHSRNRAIINLVGAGFGAAVTLLNEILAARFLGISTYGLFAIGMLLAKISELVSHFGLPLTLFHFIPLYRERDDRSRLIDTVLAGLTLPLILSVLFSVSLWFFAADIAGGLFNEPRATNFIKMLALAVPLLSLTEIIGQITRAYGHAIYFVLIRNVIPPLCYALLLLSLLALDAPAIGISVAFVTAYATALVFAILVLGRIVGEPLTAYRTSFQWAEIYRYAWPISFSTLLFLIFRWTDIFVVGIYLDANEIGKFRACLQMVIVFELIAVSISAAVAHQYSILARSGNLAETQRILTDNIRWITLLIAPVSALIVFNSSEILSLMGSEFIEARNVLITLVLAYTVKSIGTSLGLILMISGKQFIEVRIAIAVVATNLLLNFTLVPVMGAQGAALSTLTASIIFTCLRIAGVKRMLGLNYPLSRVSVLIGLAFSAGALIYFLMPLLIDIGLPGRLFLLIILLAILTWRIALSQGDRDWLGKIVRSLR